MDNGLDNINSYLVMSVIGNNDIGIFLGRLYKLLVHWFKSSLVSVEHLLYISSALGGISFDTTNKTLIGIGMYKYLNIKQISQIWMRKY